MLKLQIEVTWTTRRIKKVLPSRLSRMKQAKEAMEEAVDSADFVAKMRLNANHRSMKFSMVLPKIEHSVELSQALEAGEQKSFLRRYREEWQIAISKLFKIRDTELFFK